MNMFKEFHTEYEKKIAKIAYAKIIIRIIGIMEKSRTVNEVIDAVTKLYDEVK